MPAMNCGSGNPDALINRSVTLQQIVDVWQSPLDRKPAQSGHQPVCGLWLFLYDRKNPGDEFRSGQFKCHHSGGKDFALLVCGQLFLAEFPAFLSSDSQPIQMRLHTTFNLGKISETEIG